MKAICSIHKSVCLALLTVLLLINSTRPLLAEESSNLAKNGDFQSGTEHWEKLPGISDEDINFSVKDDSEINSKVMHIEIKKKDGSYGVQTVVSIEPGKSYKLSGEVRRSSGSKQAYIRLEWYASEDGSGSGSGNKTDLEGPNTIDQWVTIPEKEVKAPSDVHSAKIRLLVTNEDDSESAAADFDDIKLIAFTPTPTPEPTNTPTPTATPEPTNTPTPSKTPTPSNSPTPKPSPTGKPIPTKSEDADDQDLVPELFANSTQEEIDQIRASSNVESGQVLGEQTTSTLSSTSQKQSSQQTTRLLITLIFIGSGILMLVAAIIVYIKQSSGPKRS